MQQEDFMLNILLQDLGAYIFKENHLILNNSRSNDVVNYNAFESPVSSDPFSNVQSPNQSDPFSSIASSSIRIIKPKQSIAKAKFSSLELSMSSKSTRAAESARKYRLKKKMELESRMSELQEHKNENIFLRTFVSKLVSAKEMSELKILLERVSQDPDGSGF